MSAEAVALPFRTARSAVGVTEWRACEHSVMGLSHRFHGRLPARKGRAESAEGRHCQGDRRHPERKLEPARRADPPGRARVCARSTHAGKAASGGGSAARRCGRERRQVGVHVQADVCGSGFDNPHSNRKGWLSARARRARWSGSSRQICAIGFPTERVNSTEPGEHQSVHESGSIPLLS